MTVKLQFLISIVPLKILIIECSIKYCRLNWCICDWCFESNASILLSLLLDKMSKWNKTWNVVQNCVLSFYISFFHKILSLFNTKLQMLNKFFEPDAVELFKLFSKPLSHSSFNIFITCEMNSFQTLLQSCNDAEVRWCKI
jgi:hypothetical protein